MFAHGVPNLLFRAGVAITKLGQQIFTACQQFAEARFSLFAGILCLAARLLRSRRSAIGQEGDKRRHIIAPSCSSMEMSASLPLLFVERELEPEKRPDAMTNTPFHTCAGRERSALPDQTGGHNCRPTPALRENNAQVRKLFR